LIDISATTASGRKAAVLRPDFRVLNLNDKRRPEGRRYHNHFKLSARLNNKNIAASWNKDF
jgi:hypothetical protein